jgi:hypothetical protein
MIGTPETLITAAADDLLSGYASMLTTVFSKQRQPCGERGHHGIVRIVPGGAISLRKSQTCSDQPKTKSRNRCFFLKGLQNGRQRSKQVARLARPANSAADLFWTIDTRGRFVSLTYSCW